MNKAKWYEYLTPVLLAVFPILSLAQNNIDFVNIPALYRPLIITLGVTAVFYLLYFLILKDPIKAGLLAGILAFLLLFYGNLYLLLQARLSITVDHRWLLPAVFAFYLAVAGLIIFKVRDPRGLNSAVELGVLAIIGYLAVSIGIYEYKVYHTQASLEEDNAPLASELSAESIANLPDIYLILVDGHTRSDVLEEVYGLDNSDFIQDLEDMGFWVADCSTSNYPITYLSTASMFGLDYLHHLYEDSDHLVLPPLDESTVFQVLSDHAYQTITFQNFVFAHFNINNDIRYARESTFTGSITEFERLIVDTSILRILIDMEGVFPDSWVYPFDDNLYLRHYRDTLFALNTLPTLPELEMAGNKFVYAHLLVTHDPFVFHADGTFNDTRFITPEEYIESVEYIDAALPHILEEIIAKSDKPPIIIVMGDHGAVVKGRPIEERFENLFAIYIPGTDPVDAGFYDGISLVNVFRLLFNDLFNADYAVLGDRSYDVWQTNDLADIDKVVKTYCSPQD
ncbi:MAG: sulfatase-like hydrolase/transferase [Anaerolineaceae bacterium]|nr:sulfatase-like hydrolase/transferase [Anaerolineaceae bacterium]